MNLHEPHNTKSAQKLTQGIIWGLVLSLLGLLNIQIGSVHLSLQFLPVAIAVLWPSQISPALSYIAMFVIGLLFDILCGGPLGFSSLILLICFFELNDYNWKEESLLGHWALFGLAIGLAGFCLVVLARIFLGLWVPFIPLLINMVFALAVFPFVFWLWKLLGTKGRTDAPDRVSL